MSRMHLFPALGGGGACKVKSKMAAGQTETVRYFRTPAIYHWIWVFVGMGLFTVRIDNACNGCQLLGQFNFKHSRSHPFTRLFPQITVYFAVRDCSSLLSANEGEGLNWCCVVKNTIILGLYI